MARTLKDLGACAAAGLVLSALVLASAASVVRAQEPADVSGAGDCKSLDEATARASPLPRVEAALRQGKTLRILTFGASPGAGRKRGGYTGLIEQILEKAVKGLDVVMINRGVSGELAEQAARRMPVEVALNVPDLVLWQVGVNDALAYVPVEEVAGTVLRTITWLRAHNIDVILVGLQFVDERLRDAHYIAVRDRLRALGAQENVIILRRDEAVKIIATAGTQDTESFSEDVQRNEASYSCLAQQVARAVALGAFGRRMPPQPDLPPAPN
jgi:acyl-CoA thioesterase I